LNGVIFLGSIVLVEKGFAPLIRSLLVDSSNSNTTLAVVGDKVSLSFFWAYYFFLIYPLYGLSFILNTMWYHDIAETACRLTWGNKASSTSFNYRSWRASISTDLYRFIVFVPVYLMQVVLLSFVPYIGLPLSGIQLCALYSLSAFEYKWVFQGMTLFDRLAHIEENWPYFIGFGSPVVLATILFPTFISNGLYAFLFPVLILLTINAETMSHSPQSSSKSTVSPSDNLRPAASRSAQRSAAAAAPPLDPKRNKNFADIHAKRPGLPFFRYHVAFLGWFLQRMCFFLLRRMDSGERMRQRAPSE